MNVSSQQSQPSPSPIPYNRNDAKVLGPAISIPVFFFLLAVAGVGYFAYKKNRFGVSYSASTNRGSRPNVMINTEETADQV